MICRTWCKTCKLSGWSAQCQKSENQMAVVRRRRVKASRCSPVGGSAQVSKPLGGLVRASGRRREAPPSFPGKPKRQRSQSRNPKSPEAPSSAARGRDGGSPPPRLAVAPLLRKGEARSKSERRGAPPRWRQRRRRLSLKPRRLSRSAAGGRCRQTSETSWGQAGWQRQALSGDLAWNDQSQWRS